MTTRRSPTGPDRRRDAERTKHVLLEAAAAEFAEKGRAGARVSAIAARAGVNAQLISYYFGGKGGLYDELLRRWAEDERESNDPDLSLSEVSIRFLEMSRRTPQRQRLLVRAALDADPATVDHEPAAPEVADVRRRQAAGEIADDIDPAFLLLALQAIVTAPIVFPAEVKRLFGVAAGSDEFVALASAQLRVLMDHLEPRRG